MEKTHSAIMPESEVINSTGTVTVCDRFAKGKKARRKRQRKKPAPFFTA